MIYKFNHPLSIICFLLLFSIITISGYAQSDEGELLQDSTIVVDTSLYQPGLIFEGYIHVSDTMNFEKHLIQNPTKGLFKSMLVPGWGQLGNKRTKKALVYFGLDVWFVGAAIHYGKQTSDFKAQYDAIDPTDIDSRNIVHSLFMDRKDERNKFRWFAVIITFVSMFDAFADAHLSGFPNNETDSKLSFDIKANEKYQSRLMLTYSF